MWRYGVCVGTQMSVVLPYSTRQDLSNVGLPISLGLQDSVILLFCPSEAGIIDCQAHVAGAWFLGSVSGYTSNALNIAQILDDFLNKYFKWD